MKHCERCNTPKEEADFNVNPRTRDGLSTYCTQCTREITREWKANNRDKVTKQQQRYRERRA